MLAGAIGRLKGWLLQENPELRRAPRGTELEVVVYYWDGSAPEGRHIRDISATGAYIYTMERWYLGTIIRIILQGYQTVTRADGTTAPAASTCIPARVVRHGPDGVAVEFAFHDKAEEKAFQAFLAAIPAQPARNAPSTMTAPRKGQALIEFSLVIPLLFLLVVNAVNFGGFLFAWITVANAARTGAQYWIGRGAGMGAPSGPSVAQVNTLVTNDISSLLNRASLIVRVCTNTNGVVACSGAGSTVPPNDPEPLTYLSASVDVTYTYQPFIRAFDFTSMAVHATLPGAAIHSRAVMRVAQ